MCQSKLWQCPSIPLMIRVGEKRKTVAATNLELSNHEPASRNLRSFGQIPRIQKAVVLAHRLKHLPPEYRFAVGGLCHASSPCLCVAGRSDLMQGESPN